MRRLSLALAGVLALVLLASPVTAQLLSNEVYVNAPFQIAATHNGVNATGFKLYRNGTLVATVQKSTNWANNEVTFPQRTEAAVGTFQYKVTAFNTDGTTTLESDLATASAIDVVVKPALVAPSNPTLPRLIRVTQ